MKICTKCKQEKELIEFKSYDRKLDSGKSYLYTNSICIICVKEKTKEYNNKSEVKQRKNKWNNDHYDDRKEYFKKRYQNNKEEFKKYSQTVKFKDSKRRTKQKRRKNDPLFRVRENVSNAIGKALRKGKSNKAGQSILKFVGWTINDLKSYLEKQFDQNMSWENYGSYWHIDHIIPQSDLPYKSMEEDNFKACWALSNLRPLEAKQNCLDGVLRIRHKKQ